MVQQDCLVEDAHEHLMSLPPPTQSSSAGGGLAQRPHQWGPADGTRLPPAVPPAELREEPTAVGGGRAELEADSPGPGRRGRGTAVRSQTAARGGGGGSRGAG